MAILALRQEIRSTLADNSSVKIARNEPRSALDEGR